MSTLWNELSYTVLLSNESQILGQIIQWNTFSVNIVQWRKIAGFIFLKLEVKMKFYMNIITW